MIQKPIETSINLKKNIIQSNAYRKNKHNVNSTVLHWHPNENKEQTHIINQNTIHKIMKKRKINKAMSQGMIPLRHEHNHQQSSYHN